MLRIQNGKTYMFAVVAAVDEKRGIAKQGGIPWQLKQDRQFFKSLTCSTNPAVMQSGFPVDSLIEEIGQDRQRDPTHRNAVIMGRKTWESLPLAFRPLPGRHNVIVSRSYSGHPLSDVSLSRSFTEALEVSRSKGNLLTFVIGGAEVFVTALKHSQCRKILLTEIMQDFACDMFMPKIPAAYREMSCTETYQEGGVCFRIKVLERY